MKNSKIDLFPKTFCTLAWNQIHVTPSGVVKPCCIYEDSIKKEDGSSLRISDDEIEKIWNARDFRNLRLKMIKGESISGCEKCYQEEKLSQTSDRIKHFVVGNDFADRVTYSKDNDGHAEYFPYMLNLKIGNNCNLKCRMCQPLDSSLIDGEFLKVSKANPAFRNFDNASAFDYNYDENPIELTEDWILNSLAIDNIKKIMKNVTQLALAGGEIVISPEVIKFLRFCIDQGYAKNISLFISTNLTKINDSFLKIFASFKLTTVLASIDGTENVLEYIRFPSKWDNVYSNFMKLVDAPANVLPELAPTIQIYNILNIVDVLEIMDQIHSEKWKAEKGAYQPQPCQLTILFSPQHLSIRHLPKNIKEIAYQRIKKYYERSEYAKSHETYRLQLELLMNTLLEDRYDAGEGISSAEYLSHFMQYTNDLDKIRNQRMQDYLPELYELLAKENIVPSYPRENQKSFSYFRYRDNGFELYKMGKIKEALFSFERAYELDKKDTDLLFSMAIIYNEMKETEKADEFYREIYRLKPDHYYNLVQMALSQIDKKEFIEAQSYLEKAQLVRPVTEGHFVEELLEICIKNIP